MTVEQLPLPPDVQELIKEHGLALRFDERYAHTKIFMDFAMKHQEFLLETKYEAAVQECIDVVRAYYIKSMRALDDQSPSKD